MNQDCEYRDQPGASLQRFRSWFIGSALPLWTDKGYDETNGGFFEALNFDATPSLERPRRVRSQARQIHAFSQAGIRGWSASSEDLAVRGFDHFLRHACPDDGARGCAHLLHEDGSIIDKRRDLYDQAFLLLACASRWQAAKDERALALADRTLDFLDRELTSSHGGWLESDRKELPRRQNPHMHLFEAFMALYRATRDERYLDYAKQVAQIFFNAFYDEEHGVLRERFTEDLRNDHTRDMIEPGHMFEWVWLLKTYEKLSGEDFSLVRATLYRHAEKYGADSNFHWFVNNEAELKAPGRSARKRLWPQTEYLRASLVQAADGDREATVRAGSLVNHLFTTYLNTKPPGLWIDEFDSGGAPIGPDVPASILYHLLEAAAEAEDFMAAGKDL